MTDRRIQITARDVGAEKLDSGDYLTLEGVHAKGETYGPAKLKALWSIGSSFERCNFDGLRVEDAHFGSGSSRSEYIECTFDGASLRAPVVGWARFERCSFRDVRLRNWHSTADFIDCVFSGRADQCLFHASAEDPATGAPVRPVEFRGNDFSGMDFRDVAFRGGVDLRLQRLPAGPDDVFIEDASEALTRARDSLRAWSDDRRREDALLDIDLLQREVDLHHQSQLYVRVSDLERDPVTQRALLKALRPEGEVVGEAEA
jgi:hypothetical protein